MSVNYLLMFIDVLFLNSHSEIDLLQVGPTLTTKLRLIRAQQCIQFESCVLVMFNL